MPALISSSILAGLCVPEKREVCPTVSISELWQWTWTAVEGAPRGAHVVQKWATKDYENSGERRENYRLRSAVNALLTEGLTKGTFILRVHDGHQVWRIPHEAFSGWLDGMDLEMTWAAGRLWQFDTTDRYRPVADMELPLLLTEKEQEMFQSFVLKEIAIAQGLPVVDDAELAKWVADWSVRRFWPVREAVLWVATRELQEAGQLALGSAWDGCGEFGLVGALQATADVQGQRDWRRIIEPEPEAALLAALRNGRVTAHGLFEGNGPMRLIAPAEWTTLEFGVVPKGQRDRSEAHTSAAKMAGQYAGATWRGHWTGIAIERLTLFAAFPPVPLAHEEAPSAREWLDALQRRPLWNAAELTAWVGFRRWAPLAAEFGPEGQSFGALTIGDESRLRFVSECLEDNADAHDRTPRFAVERAVQRGGLLARGAAPGVHVTHSLEDLLHYEFWREDVLGMFPDLGEPQLAPESVAPTHTPRRVPESIAAKGFADWVKGALLSGELPKPLKCYTECAQPMGRSREWARQKVGDLPPVLRYRIGQSKIEIGGEHWAAYSAYFRQV